MRFRIRHSGGLVLSITIFLLIVTPAAFAPVAATGGSFELAVQGYGTVHGQLEDAAIQPNNTVSVTMLLNDQLQTSQGTFQTSARGVWNGVRNGSALSGQIRDVGGKVHICFLIACSDANFVAEGLWRGLLNAIHGTGDLNGTITFTNSPVPQIPVGQPIPVAGTWAADFQTPIPEFRTQFGVYILAFVATALVMSARRTQTQAGRRGNS
jgi:hypothetical protein